MITSPPDERALLLDAITRSARNGQVRLLEAGCGQKWGLVPDGISLHITGVDTDAQALQIRQENHGDLARAIVADLRDVELPKAEFDVVYCSYVLEHVEGAEDVLNRMVRSLRPGGRLLTRFPDGQSVFGWLAQHTSHTMHVWFKKYVERFPDAGKPGHAPYPVVYDDVVSLAGIRRWAGRAGVHLEHEYATNYYMKKFGRLARPVDAGLRGIAACSMGRLTAKWNNIGFVFRID